MKDCKEAITIPDGCYATIEGNKVVFRKWAYPIPRALEVAALYWRMDNCPSSPDTISAFVSGAEWQREQFENERLKHCDELTAEQAQIESEFVVQHLKNFNRTPTFIDAIEYVRRQAMEKVLSKLENLCKQWSLCTSAEAKYRLEAYKELLEILKEE